MVQTRSMYKREQGDILRFIGNGLRRIEYVQCQEDRISHIYDLFEFILKYVDLISSYDSWQQIKICIIRRLNCLSSQLRRMLHDRAGTEKEIQLLELLENPAFHKMRL